MNKNARYILWTISLVFITSALVFALYYRGVEQRKNVQEQDAVVKGNTELGSYPRVDNIPPSDAYVGVSYSFKPYVAVEGSREALSFELAEAPDWLFLYNDRLIGIPSINDVGEGKVILRIGNGDIYSDFTYYIKVYEKNGLDNN